MIRKVNDGQLIIYKNRERFLNKIGTKSYSMVLIKMNYETSNLAKYITIKKSNARQHGVLFVRVFVCLC